MENKIIYHQRDSKNKVLKIIDIYDEIVMRSIEKKHEVRQNKNEYKKIKIASKPNQNYKFFVKQIKDYIRDKKLYNGNVEINLEYLTKNGWVSSGDAYNELNQKKLYNIPSIDKGLESGRQNNQINPDEQIYLVRLNIFKFK